MVVYPHFCCVSDLGTLAEKPMRKPTLPGCSRGSSHGHQGQHQQDFLTVPLLLFSDPLSTRLKTQTIWKEIKGFTVQ